MLFNVAIYEGGDVGGGSAGLVCGLRNSEGVEQFIEHLDGLLILGFGVGRI